MTKFVAPTFTNPYVAGTDAHDEWERAGTKTLASTEQALVKAADWYYARQDQAWFNALPTESLTTLWALVSGINSFSGIGAWDDEVYEALHARGHFDTEN